MLDSRGMILDPLPPQHHNEEPIKEMAVKLMAVKVELEEVLERRGGDRRPAIPPNVPLMKKESWGT